MFAAKTAPRPAAEDAAAVAARVDTARQTIITAKQRIPLLRNEDKKLEAEITNLIGLGMADGVSRSTEVAARRARRAEIATQIEEMQAESSMLERGLAVAEAKRIDADRKAAREEAIASRSEAARLVKRAVAALRELWQLDTKLALALRDEETAYRREVRLGATLNPPVTAAPPASKAVDTGHDPLAMAFEALAGREPRKDLMPETITGRAAAFDEAIRRIEAFAASALAANGDNGA